jgi:hypothetical protein
MISRPCSSKRTERRPNCKNSLWTTTRSAAGTPPMEDTLLQRGQTPIANRRSVPCTMRIESSCVANRIMAGWWGKKPGRAEIAAWVILMLPFWVLCLLVGSTLGQEPPKRRWIGACSAPHIYRHFVVYIDRDDKGNLNGFYLDPPHGLVLGLETCLPRRLRQSLERPLRNNRDRRHDRRHPDLRVFPRRDALVHTVTLCFLVPLS